MALLRTTQAMELWWPEKAEPWLKTGNVPADCVSDLRTQKNTLSVYEVADADQAKRVAAAIALSRAVGGAKNRQSLSDIAAMLFEPHVLDQIGVRRDKKKGNTEDADVNGWHVDLIELSGNQLVELTKHLLQNSTKRTFFKKELLQEVKVGRDSGRITKVPERVAEQIAELEQSGAPQIVLAATLPGATERVGGVVQAAPTQVGRVNDVPPPDLQAQEPPHKLRIPYGRKFRDSWFLRGIRYLCGLVR